MNGAGCEEGNALLAMAMLVVPSLVAGAMLGVMAMKLKVRRQGKS